MRNVHRFDRFERSTVRAAFVAVMVTTVLWVAVLIWAILTLVEWVTHQ